MSATMGAMPQPPRKNVRSFRIDDRVWVEAQRIATERQESLSDVVLRPALETYVQKHRQLAAVDALSKIPVDPDAIVIDPDA